MRALIFALTGLFIASVVTAAYAPKTVENYFGYSNMVSKTFAGGDSGDASGWRECLEMENTAREVGLACEGTRTIQIHSGKLVEVNYYCEFRFRKVDPFSFKVELEACQ